MKTVSEHEVRKILRSQIGAVGGLREWCRGSGVKCNSHVSEFLNGKRNPPTDVLKALGLEYRIVWAGM